MLIRLLPKLESEIHFGIVVAKLAFPTSLPDFVQLFPDDAACAAYLEMIRWPEGFVCLPLVHLVFGNLKTWLKGIHHGVSPQHLQAYLNEFTFRFNRRFFPFNAFHSLLDIGAATEPTTYAALYNSGSPSKLFRNPPIGN